MEVRKIGNKEFLVFTLEYKHYSKIHLHREGKYKFTFGNLAHSTYLKNNPNTGILILEEGEVDDLQRRPLLVEIDKYRNEHKLSNLVYILYQGTGQDSYMNFYLNSVKPYVTFIRSQSAMYNFVMNWSNVHSGIEDPHLLITELYSSFFQFTSKSIDKSFVLLGGKSRAARLMFLDKVLEHNLDKDSYMSFHNEYLKLDHDLVQKYIDSGMTYRQVIANHHSKSEVEYLGSKGILLSNKEITTIKEIHSKLPIFNLPRKTDDYYYDPYMIIPDPDLYKRIFVDIVLETFHFRGIVKDPLFKNINFFTEKVAKPLLAFRPFMVLSNKHYLRDLKTEFGIKTFDKYWDESYDEVDTAQKAINIVIENMRYINSKTKPQLAEMIYEMKPILTHNNRVMREYFLGEPNWVKVMNKYVEGKGVSWKGTQTNNTI
jgi:hypothetical protein